jgi:hypothetical protein
VGPFVSISVDLPSQEKQTHWLDGGYWNASHSFIFHSLHLVVHIAPWLVPVTDQAIFHTNLSPQKNEYYKKALHLSSHEKSGLSFSALKISCRLCSWFFNQSPDSPLMHLILTCTFALHHAQKKVFEVEVIGSQVD